MHSQSTVSSQSVLELIEPEAEVVNSIRSGNVPIQSIHPGPLPCPQEISTQRERESAGFG